MTDERAPGRRGPARAEHERREHEAAEQASREHDAAEHEGPEYEHPGNPEGERGHELSGREKRERGALSDEDRDNLENAPAGPASVGHPGWEKGDPAVDDRSVEDKVRDVEKITAESPQGYSPTAGLGT